MSSNPSFQASPYTYMKNQSQNPATESEIYYYHNSGDLNLHQSHFDKTIDTLLNAQNMNQTQANQNKTNFSQQQSSSSQYSFSHNKQNAQPQNYNHQNMQYQQQNQDKNSISISQQHNNQQQGQFLQNSYQTIQNMQNQQPYQQIQNAQLEIYYLQQQYQYQQPQQQDHYQQQNSSQSQNNQQDFHQGQSYLSNNTQQAQNQNQFQNNQYFLNQYPQYSNNNLINYTQGINNQQFFTQSNYQQEQLTYQNNNQNNASNQIEYQHYKNESQNQQLNSGNLQQYAFLKQNQSNQFNDSNQQVTNQSQSQPIYQNQNSQSFSNTNQYLQINQPNLNAYQAQDDQLQQNVYQQQSSNFNNPSAQQQSIFFEQQNENISNQQHNFSVDKINQNQHTENCHNQSRQFLQSQVTNVSITQTSQNQNQNQSSQVNDYTNKNISQILQTQLNQTCENIKMLSDQTYSKIQNQSDYEQKQPDLNVSNFPNLYSNQSQQYQLNDSQKPNQQQYDQNQLQQQPKTYEDQQQPQQINQSKICSSKKQNECNNIISQNMNSNQYQNVQEQSQQGQNNNINVFLDEQNQEQSNDNLQNVNSQNKEQHQGEGDAQHSNIQQYFLEFQEVYEIQYGKVNNKKNIFIRTEQFQQNEINYQFLTALHEFTSQNFDYSKYYKKNKNKRIQPQTLKEYAQEQYRGNKYKQTQIENIYQENQDSFNYILDLRRGDHSFFRAAITGFLLQIFNEKYNEEDSEEDTLIQQIFVKFYYTKCSDVSILEQPFDGFSDLNLSINYRNYFLNCILYLFAHKFSDYSDIYIISELLQMCYKDEAFDFSMLCFGISLCNLEMSNLKYDEVFSQFFDENIGQIDFYIFDMNEIQQQALVQSLQVDIKSFKLTVDQKDKSKFKVEEELLIPSSKEILFNIKMIQHNNIYMLVYDEREEKNFKYKKDKSNKKENKLNQNTKIEKKTEQEINQCIECGKKLEFEQQMHRVCDEITKQEFCFCVEHINYILSLNNSQNVSQLKYTFKLLGNDYEELYINVDKIKISSLFDKIINKQFPNIKTQCYFCNNMDQNLLINLVTSSKLMQPVICLNCASKKIKEESKSLKEKYLKFKNVLKRDDLIQTRDLFKNFILRESQTQVNCQCCQKNIKKKSYSFSIEDIYVQINLCEECLKQPFIELEKLKIQLNNPYSQKYQKNSLEINNEKKFSNEQQFSKVQVDQRFNKEENKNSHLTTNINQYKIVNNQTSQQQLNTVPNQAQDFKEYMNKTFTSNQTEKQINNQMDSSFTSSNSSGKEKSLSVDSVDDILYLKDHLEIKEIPQNEDNVIKIQQQMSQKGQDTLNQYVGKNINSIDDKSSIKEYLQMKDVSENDQSYQQKNKIKNQQVAEFNMNLNNYSNIKNMTHNEVDNQKKLQNLHFSIFQPSQDKFLQGQKQNYFQGNQEIIKNNQIESKKKPQQNMQIENIQYQNQQIFENKNNVQNMQNQQPYQQTQNAQLELSYLQQQYQYQQPQQQYHYQQQNSSQGQNNQQDHYQGQNYLSNNTHQAQNQNQFQNNQYLQNQYPQYSNNNLINYTQGINNQQFFTQSNYQQDQLKCQNTYQNNASNQIEYQHYKNQAQNQQLNTGNLQQYAFLKQNQSNQFNDNNQQVTNQSQSQPIYQNQNSQSFSNTNQYLQINQPNLNAYQAQYDQLYQNVYQNVQEQSQQGQSNNINVFLDEQNQEQSNDNLQNVNSQNKKQYQGEGDAQNSNIQQYFLEFQEVYEIQYGKVNNKKNIFIITEQFQQNAINYQFLTALHEFTSQNFDYSNYYKKNKNKRIQPQTLKEYAQEQYRGNKYKQTQIENIYQENQDSFNYILDLRRGDHSFFRAAMTGFLLQIFNEKHNEEDSEEDTLIQQIFVKFYDTKCSDVSILEQPFDGFSDLNLSINYRNYFLNCILYLLAHKFSDYSGSYIISELLQMCYKDEAFDFSMLCFGISLCNLEMSNLKYDEVFSQFFDENIGQIDFYIFEMNEIQLQALVQSLQVDIKSFKLTVDQKDKSKFKVEEELLIPSSKEILFNIKMIWHNNIYMLVFDEREEKNFKYKKDKSNKKENKLNQNTKIEKKTEQQINQCIQCGRKLEFEQQMHRVCDEITKQEFCFCVEHICCILSLNHSQNLSQLKYTFKLLGNVYEELYIYVDKIKISSLFDKIINKQFPNIKTQCYFCNNMNQNLLINLVTSQKLMQPVICLNCASKKIKEKSKSLKEKYIKFKNVLKRDDLILTRDLFKNFILRESQTQVNCQCCQKNIKKISYSFSIEDIYVQVNLCEECLKQPFIELEKLNIQLNNPYCQKYQKNSLEIINEQKFSNEQQFSKVQVDQRFNKEENKNSHLTTNINQYKIVNNQTSQQQLNTVPNQAQGFKEYLIKTFTSNQTEKQINDQQQSLSQINLSQENEQLNQKQFQYPINQQNIINNNNNQDFYYTQKQRTEISQQKNFQKQEHVQSLEFITQQSLQTIQNSKIVQITEVKKSQKLQQQTQQLKNQNKKKKQNCIKCNYFSITQALLVDMPGISKQYQGFQCLSCISTKFNNIIQKENIYSKAYKNNLFYCFQCGYRFFDRTIRDLILLNISKNIKQSIQCADCGQNNIIQLY
ncbi:hypothetical protein ABPG72_017212 [Tetrahymena utriculariae]